jgi:hypothetical protein
MCLFEPSGFAEHTLQHRLHCTESFSGFFMEVATPQWFAPEPSCSQRYGGCEQFAARRAAAAPDPSRAGGRTMRKDLLTAMGMGVVCAAFFVSEVAYSQ